MSGSRGRWQGAGLPDSVANIFTCILIRTWTFSAVSSMSLWLFGRRDNRQGTQITGQKCSKEAGESALSMNQAPTDGYPRWRSLE